MAKLFILSAPSGAGKTTVAQKLLKSLDNIKKIVTATTREPRPGEVHGVDYLFMTREEFEKGIEEDRFFEYANVYGNYYGTPKDQVERNLKEGVDSLLVIDVQGAFKVKSKVPEAVTVFLLPPSLEELRRRLLARGYLDKNVDVRLETALKEIPCAKAFDYIIINDFVDKAVDRLRSIILASRSEKSRVLSALEKEGCSKDIKDLIEGGECYVEKA